MAKSRHQKERQKEAVKARRQVSREEAKKSLVAIISGTVDAYEGYRRLWVLYCSNPTGLEEIKPMFRISGIDPAGVFSVTPEFRVQVRVLSEELLPLVSN